MKFAIFRAALRMRLIALTASLRKVSVLGIAAVLLLIALVITCLTFFASTATTTGTPVGAPPSSNPSARVVRPSPHVSPAPSHKMQPSAHAPKPHPRRVRSAPPVRASASYTVRTGDSLWAIAAHVYRSPLKWHKLYQLNRSQVGSNPSLIHTGMVLRT